MRRTIPVRAILSAACLVLSAPAIASEFSARFSGFQEVLNGTRSAADQAAALQAAWEKAKQQGKIATQE